MNRARIIFPVSALLLFIAAPGLAYARAPQPQDQQRQQHQDRSRQQVHTQQAQPQQHQAQRAQPQQHQAQRTQQQRQQVQQRTQQHQTQRAQQPQYQRQQTQRNQQPRVQERRTIQQRQRQQVEQRNVWRQRRATNWNTQRRTWAQRGGYHGYRIPSSYFSRYYGRRHFFRIYSLPFMYVGGYPRFQYAGYWFIFLDPYPEYWGPDWYQTDDLYIDYYDGGYYLYNLRYPGYPGIAVSIAF